MSDHFTNIKVELMATISDEIYYNGWTQAAASQRLGCSQPRISNIANGKHHLFSIDSLLDICSELGMDVQVVVNSRNHN